MHCIHERRAAISILTLTLGLGTASPLFAQGSDAPVATHTEAAVSDDVAGSGGAMEQGGAAGPRTAPVAVPPAQQVACPGDDGCPNGWKAFMRAAAGDFAAFPRQRATWAILGMGAAAALAGHPADRTLNGRLAGRSDPDAFWGAGKWVGQSYTHLGVGIGVHMLGRYFGPAERAPERSRKFSHVGIDLVRAQLVTQAIVQGMKPLVGRARPTGECCAFPSGHSATAFAAASVLERHFGYRAAWPAVAVATYVATSRLHDNRHYLSDVIFGSAVGMAAGWTVVGRHGRSEFGIVPTPVPGGVAVVVSSSTR